jgi:predicted nucleic acid-binding Zn ribbon protein
MRRLQDVMHDAIPQSEVLKRARAQLAFDRWPEVVGEGLARYSRPDRWDKGVLWIAVDGSAWAQELAIRKPLILERMNNFAGENLFIDIRTARAQNRGIKPESE